MAAGRQQDFKVVGLTFVEAPNTPYPENLYRLNEIFENRQRDAIRNAGLDVNADELLPVVLIRNPANEYDANAIEVHVPALGKHGMIGHVPAWLAKKLAPSLDRGDTWSSGLQRILIDPDHPDKPGASVTIELLRRAGEPQE